MSIVRTIRGARWLPVLRRVGLARPQRERQAGRGLWWAWLVPATALTALFTVYPALAAIRLSAYQWPGYGPQVYVGAANYRALFAAPVFKQALGNTISFAVVTALGTVGVGTAIALVLDSRMPLSRVLKAVIFLPVILPIVFTGLVWEYGLDTDLGWVNNLLNAIHHGLGQGWLSNPSLVMWTIEIVTILQFAGLPMIIILAALEDVPREIHEAALVEGANAWRRARYISLPLVKDVILTMILLQLMYGFKVFDQVFVMTNGGPGNASQVMSTYVFNEAFTLQHFGLGAAGAVTTSLIVIVVSMAYLTVFRTGRIERA
jgi:raffinose/stachyose/melibiose transport system permease protein